MSARPQPATTGQPGPQPTTRPGQHIQVPAKACGCLPGDWCGHECWTCPLANGDLR